MMAALTPADVAALQASTLLRDAAESTVARMRQAAEPVVLDADQEVMREGSRGEAVYVIVDGELAVSKRTGDREVPLSVCKAGEVIGELSVLQDLAVSATVRTVKPTRLLRVPADAFLSLLEDPVIARRMLTVVAGRLANTQAQLQESEKLASLGAIAAGIAHELNNPAAALIRATTQLGEHLRRLHELSGQLAAEAPGALARATQIVAAQPPEPAPRAGGLLAQSDAEEELSDWLASLGVPSPWDFASALLARGLDQPVLAHALAGVDATVQAALAEWLARGAALFELTGHAQDAATRISSVVADVKGYSHLDQAPRGRVDLSKQLTDTLALLKHKTPVGITVHKEFAPDTPQVDGLAAELNQVWTNLIDNALDAMKDSGTLTLRTYGDGESAVVEVADTGGGIPAELVERIFEPFVTSKPVGSGTGLGLYLARDIVVRGHGGDLSVESSAEGTTFRVRLPA